MRINRARLPIEYVTEPYFDSLGVPDRKEGKGLRTSINAFTYHHPDDVPFGQFCRRGNYCERCLYKCEVRK